MAQDIPHMASFEAWRRHSSEQRRDTELVVHSFLSAEFPDHHVTRTWASACDWLSFAAAGFATATREHTAGFDATRGYMTPKARLGQEPGKLIEEIRFGRWRYAWQEREYIIYLVQGPEFYGRPNKMLYILSVRGKDAVEDGHHAATDSLIVAASQWTKALDDEIYVYDSQRWKKDEKLYLDVSGSSWDDVVLDPAMKRSLVQDVMSFFDNCDLYKSLNVPWKRGVIFHGVPGNGKTISLKALINALNRRQDPIPSLYVKSFDGCNGKECSIQEIFSHARTMAPCLLIFEDLDSLVVDQCRSYFLNEVDGLESNDGILMIGSTNHLDRLDPAITKRPSRFDRKYHFRVPNLAERLEYCRFWSRKFTSSATVDFPDDICHAIAAMTEDFSFAYLKELFITSLLELARGGTGEGDDDASEAETTGHPNDSTSVTDSVIVEHPVPDPKDSVDDAGKPSAASKVNESAETSGPNKAKRMMPEVEIAEAIRDNVLLKIVTKQTRLLIDEMDNT